MPVGTRLRMVGNSFEAGGLRVGWLGTKTGRPATAAELKRVHNPYSATAAKKLREEAKADDELDDAAAVEACRLEQEREPADLISSVA